MALRAILNIISSRGPLELCLNTRRFNIQEHYSNPDLQMRARVFPLGSALAPKLLKLMIFLAQSELLMWRPEQVAILLYL